MTTTRYYLTDAAPGVVVARAGVWSATLNPSPNTPQTLTAVRPSSGSAGGATNQESGTTTVSLLGKQAIGAGTLPAGTLTGTYALAVKFSENTTLADAYVRAVLRVVSGDGLTVRGTLFDKMADTETSGSGAVVALSGALTPVVAQAGDRLVFEVGAEMRNATSLASGFTMTGSTFTAADYPAVTGSTATGTSWLELVTTDPPAAAPVLTVTSVGTDTIEVDWTALGDADGYEIRLDAGAWTDVGDVLEWAFTGLTPGTEYTIAVRGYNVAGLGMDDSEIVTTLELPAGYYRAAVEIGPQSWEVTRGDPPGLGIALPLSFGWTMADDATGYPAQLDPGTASLLLVVADGADLAGIDVGAVLRVRIWRDPAPTARPFATFVGRVADYEVSPHELGIAVRLLGTDYTIDLAARTVGNVSEWPEESGDDRAGRIMAENGDTPWSSEIIGNTFEPRAVQPASAYAALRETLTAAARFQDDDWSAPGRVILTPDVDAAGGLLEYRGTFVAASSSAIDKIPAAVWRATSWLRNRITDGRWVHIDHPGGAGSTIYGDRREQPRPRIAVPTYDTAALAQLALAVVPGFSWLSAAPLRIDLSHPEAPAAAVADWLWRDPDSPAVPGAGHVVVVSVCDAMPGMFTTYAGMLAAVQLTLEPAGRLYIDFRLRPDVPAHSTVTPRWMDEPPDATWLEEPPDATWYELRTIHREDYLP